MHLIELDPRILVWVFLPISAVMFMIGLLRHYASLLILSPPTVTLAQTQKMYDSRLLWVPFLDVF